MASSRLVHTSATSRPSSTPTVTHPVLPLPRRNIAVAGRSEDEVGVEEIEPVLCQIAQALAFVPLEPHQVM
jgi:hypothetical protein